VDPPFFRGCVPPPAKAFESLFFSPALPFFEFLPESFSEVPPGATALILFSFDCHSRGNGFFSFPRFGAAFSETANVSSLLLFETSLRFLGGIRFFLFSPPPAAEKSTYTHSSLGRVLCAGKESLFFGLVFFAAKRLSLPASPLPPLLLSPALDFFPSMTRLGLFRISRFPQAGVFFLPSSGVFFYFFFSAFPFLPMQGISFLLECIGLSCVRGAFLVRKVTLLHLHLLFDFSFRKLLNFFGFFSKAPLRWISGTYELLFFFPFLTIDAFHFLLPSPVFPPG